MATTSKRLKQLNPRELRRQIQLLTKLKRLSAKLCRELQFQRSCLDHVEDFSNFLKQKTTYTVTTTASEPIDELASFSQHDPLLSHNQITVKQLQQTFYHQVYDVEFQIHHQNFDRSLRYFRRKCSKLSREDTVSSLYNVLYNLFENCHVIGEKAEDDDYHKNLYALEIAEREKFQQAVFQKPSSNIEPIEKFETVASETIPEFESSVEATSSKGTTVGSVTMATRMKANKQKKTKKKKWLLRKKAVKKKAVKPAAKSRKPKSEKGHFQCPMVSCRKAYKFKDNLIKHLLQHVEVKTEVLSDEVSTTPKRGRKRRTESSSAAQSEPSSKRKRRKSSLSGESVFRCDFEGCEYTAPYRSALELHKVKHSTERPFKCRNENCEKSFKQIYALKMHEIMHQGQQYKCPFTGCNAIYSWIYSLKKHMRLHTNQAPVHRCEWPACEYTSHRQDLLRKHMTRHTGERLFSCSWPDCGKSFKTRSGLYDHLLMHKNERKQVCTWPGCNYRCNLPGNLRKHIAIHEKKVIKLEPIADADQIPLMTATNYNGAIGGIVNTVGAGVVHLLPGTLSLQNHHSHLHQQQTQQQQQQEEHQLNEGVPLNWTSLTRSISIS